MMLKLIQLAEKLNKEIPTKKDYTYFLVAPEHILTSTFVKYICNTFKSTAKAKIVRSLITPPRIEFSNGVKILTASTVCEIRGWCADHIIVFNTEKMDGNLLEAAYSMKINFNNTTIEEIR